MHQKEVSLNEKGKKNERALVNSKILIPARYAKFVVQKEAKIQRKDQTF